MALFGLIPDDTDPMSYGGGSFMLPQVQAAYANDPRAALARTLIEGGEQRGFTTPALGFSRALQQGLGAFTQARLANQYGRMSKNAQDTMAQALLAAQGSPAQTDAQGNITSPAQGPNLQAMIAKLSANPFTAPQALQTAMTVAAKNAEPQKLGPNDILTNAAGARLSANVAPMSPEGKLAQDMGQTQDPTVRAALTSALLKGGQEGGVFFSPQGALAAPGYGQAKAGIAGPVAGAEANARNASDLAYKPSIEQGVAQATLGPKVLERVAGEALTPRATTPTESLRLGLGALPPDFQSAITNAVKSTAIPPQTGWARNAPPPVNPSVVAPQAPIGTPGAPVTPNQQTATQPSPALDSVAAQGMSAPKPPPAAAGGAALPGPPPPPLGTMPAAMTPAQYEAEMGLGKDFADKDKKAYDASNQSLQSLYQMNAAADKLAATGGWATPGTAMNMRADFAKTVNTWQQSFGFKPSFDPATVSSWELMQKETKRAGMQLVNQMFGGSREAASIVQGATSAVPNSENSYLGYRLVSSGVEQSLQRERELYQFKAEALSAGKPLATAEVAFNKANPPALYTTRAVANAVPDPAVQMLQSNPALASQFDQKYGKGIAEFILKGGRTGLGSAGGMNPQGQ
jgi:hypothetical protein